jgi:neuroendocrine protein 7B2
MFDCPGSTEENQLDSIARSIQNQAIPENQLDKLVENLSRDGHKVVAKKYHQSKVRPASFLTLV